jgi:iron complex transport system permease protein
MKGRLFITLLALGALVVLATTPFVGGGTLWSSGGLLPSPGSAEGEIFYRIRLPRVLTTFVAGASLAVCGMAFQAMFRNPLATPYTLGVSSGAAFGAALYVRLGLALSPLGVSGMSFAAFLGSLLSIAAVWVVSVSRRASSTATMLLAGVAINFFFSSLIMFLQYLSDFTQSFRIVHWLMGGVEVVGYRSLLNLLPFFVIGAAIILYQMRELNLMAVGEELAVSRGVHVRRTRQVLFFATSLMVGGVVAVCGPIGFVGMMVPHICRLLIGSDHRVLTPASLLFGGIFLTLCDTLARTLIAPVEIPVGVITALLGGPFFLWLLMRGDADRGLT